ncbi:MAG: response regulator, partial [Candidatus Krumholzibacteria bacterium]|nr:response regulator [Candidatus Krumholzibacteria bacterium]
GEETLRAIKDTPEIKDVPVIILTSIGARGDAARLHALGCAGYLTKPIKQSQLHDAINTTLGWQKMKDNGKPGTLVTRHTIAEEKRRRIRILLAEDNPMNQKLAVILLGKAGYSVDTAGNGQKAVEALARKTYNVILMDVQMPVMNGFEATKAIREKEGDKNHTPIIAMTANAMKGDRELCLEAGMDDYISKPVEPQQMFDAINRWAGIKDHKKTVTRQEKSGKDTPPENTPIDFESALHRFDGDKEILIEILKEFLNHVPNQLKTLDEATEKGDAGAVEMEAHSIKGAARSLSAKRIADTALELEHLGKKGDLSTAKEITANLKTEFKKLVEYTQQSFDEEGALKS